MLALLPALTFGLAAWLSSRRLADWRVAFLYAALAVGVLLVTLTEGLSVIQALTAPALTAAWLGATLVFGVMILRMPHARPRWRSWLAHGERESLLVEACLPTLGLLVLILLGTAIVSAPNTVDSMAYHLARVAHWAQDQTVAPYPTNIRRQLALAPGAEFAILHLQLLSGSDRFAALPQWASMVGALVGVSAIAAQLGAPRPAQILAALVCASLPIGILQSTSTQNDYVVAFWLTCVAFIALRTSRAQDVRACLLGAVAFGVALGLAILTKATAYLFAAPLVIWFTWTTARVCGRRAWQPLLIVASLCVMLNAGFFARNLVLFGSPFGVADEGAPELRYTNDALTVPLLLSNIVRGIAVQANATPSASLNQVTASVVRDVHGWLGVDIADPRTTWDNDSVEALRPLAAFDETAASNPVHLLLLVQSLAVLAARPRSFGAQPSLYALALVAGFVLFCAILRWQPWHSRLELPLLVLASPLIATVVWRLAPQFGRVVALAATLSMLPWVTYNYARPLIGPSNIAVVSREEQYFVFRPELQSPFVDAASLLAQRDCQQIGLQAVHDQWEYALWALLPGREAGRPVRIEHIGVANSSAAFARADFTPCAVVALVDPAVNVSDASDR